MIFVFKTSVRTKKQVKQLQLPLNQLLPRSKWNFDLQDRDKILRVDSQNDIAKAVMIELRDRGFYCEELE